MIGFLTRRRCRAHCAALVEFAAHRTGGPDVVRALDHVDRCRACERELATTTLVLHGLRRIHEEALRAEPAADGWSRLRERLAVTRREPSRLLSGLPGIVAAAALCAVLVGPGAIEGGGPSGVYNEAPRAATAPYLLFEQSRDRARAEGLLPVPGLHHPHTGVRIKPPPIILDLPPSMRKADWIEGTMELPPDAPATAGKDGTDNHQARQEVTRTRS